ncbi:hypothetical protein DENIS_2695 [Desulfonema ishimotonii]|uniref:EamA domain-containing protein n=1 Tax=Desulfonema ishimotonii TaxID=45657 RepID=A0A401FXS2_9BACT|nr:hypothetical protein [Desulfonema ishimotonii]GBC61733.1 hypothetical protein DENIS_2695 [Desulfonema ishimotonii]
MFYLISAILSSFSISVLIKLNETRGVSTRIVIASSYISASLLGWAFILNTDVRSVSAETLMLGLGGAVLWPATFYLLMWGIRQYGLSLAGTVCRLSLIIPVLFAVIFLRERLTACTLLGLLAAFAAFYLFNPLGARDLNRADRRAIWFFPLLAICFGVVDLWVNLFNTIGPAPEKFIFMTLIFTFSNGFAWMDVYLQKLKPERDAVIRGLILGVPNFFATYFMMECLKSPVFQNQSAIVYTLYSVTGVALAFGAGVTIWKERVTRANVLGVFAVIAAIALLNY